MASIEKTEAGTFKVTIRRKGQYASKTFATKAAALGWSSSIESEIIAGQKAVAANKTLSDVLERYLKGIEKRGGYREEEIRIKRFLKSDLAKKKLGDLSVPDFAEWRDNRLAAGVKGDTVRREWCSLSGALNLAVDEWQWLPSNPLAKIKLPEKGKPRDRLPTLKEIETLLHSFGYTEGQQPETSTAIVGAAFLLACETAMRIGEIAALSWEDVDLVKRVAHVKGEAHGGGKTWAAARYVPLTTRAVRILEDMKVDGETAVLQVKKGSVDALFRKVRDRCGIKDLHFHDSRAFGITMLAKKLDILDLARAVGHKDLKMLMVYYRDSAETIASRLD